MPLARRCGASYTEVPRKGARVQYLVTYVRTPVGGDPGSSELVRAWQSLAAVGAHRQITAN
jgi:hypothetical protein